MGGLYSRGAFEQTELLRINELATMFVVFTYNLGTFERNEVTILGVSIKGSPE